jgi:hypothetical protein
MAEHRCLKRVVCRRQDKQEIHQLASIGGLVKTPAVWKITCILRRNLGVSCRMHSTR